MIFNHNRKLNLFVKHLYF